VAIKRQSDASSIGNAMLAVTANLRSSTPLTSGRKRVVDSFVERV
jgi:hypothetical protein